MNPALSVMLATRDKFDTLRGTIHHLCAQTIAEKIELVIVAPSRAGFDESALRGLGSWQIVEAGKVRSVGHGNTLGVRAARAPIVALAEDHAFPEPDWAAALLRAHERPCAAVGPAMRCGNPVNRVSWADMLIGYAQWMEPVATGSVELLPGHNSSYKRDVLLTYGDRLEAMLEAETVLHWDLRAHGHALWVEASAKINHINFARFNLWLPLQFHAGRVFAAARATGEHWPVAKRLLYIGGAPLIPLVRLARMWPIIRRLNRFSVVPVLGIGLLSDALGQLCGYAAGAGRSRELLPLYEFNRIQINATGKIPS